MKIYTLNNGISIPAIGLGTYMGTGDALNVAVEAALNAGYTSFDSAAYYENEADLAHALKLAGADRKNVTVTTKIWPTDFGYDNALKAFDASEKKLGSIDIYLVHWPCGDRFLPVWKALERIYEEKRVKAIGVCNFLPEHLRMLFANANIPPALNQVESNPYIMDYDTIEMCAENDILVEAWRPLMKSRNGLLEDPVILKIAAEKEKSPAQIILRFLIQNGLRVIPKSVTPDRIRQNIDIFSFELDESEMAAMAALKNPKFKTDRTPDSLL